jgi:hypothetical protein
MKTFEEWFRQEYPVIARALREGTQGPNELWLFEIARKAFAAGVQVAVEESQSEALDR